MELYAYRPEKMYNQRIDSYPSIVRVNYALKLMFQSVVSYILSYMASDRYGKSELEGAAP